MNSRVDDVSGTEVLRIRVRVRILSRLASRVYQHCSFSVSYVTSMLQSFVHDSDAHIFSYFEQQLFNKYHVLEAGN